jgi:CheY-like chemotaxis protein
MGGRIWVTSEPGKGSEFHFTVPLRVEQPAAPVEPPAELVGRRVVLVSHDPVGAPVYRELLEQLGLDVQIVPRLDAASVLQASGSAACLLDRPVGEAAVHVDTDPCPLIQLGYLNDISDDTQPHVLKPITIDDLRQCLLQVLAPEACQPDAVPSESSQPATTANGIKVLLADDSPVNQEVAMGLLEYKGYQVQVANNGLEAVEAVRRERFAVVLMDLEMPQMDGFEATAAIREHEAALAYRTPILAMTAHATVETQQRCQAAGMNGYISKPVNPDRLFAAVAEAVTQPAASEKA